MNFELLLQNFYDGLLITVLGVCIVLLFLSLLILAVNISRVVIGWLNVKFPAAAAVSPAKKQTGSNEDEIAAVIAAVFGFRHKA